MRRDDSPIFAGGRFQPTGPATREAHASSPGITAPSAIVKQISRRVAKIRSKRATGDSAETAIYFDGCTLVMPRRPSPGFTIQRRRDVEMFALFRRHYYLPMAWLSPVVGRWPHECLLPERAAGFTIYRPLHRLTILVPRGRLPAASEYFTPALRAEAGHRARHIYFAISLMAAMAASAALGLMPVIQSVPDGERRPRVDLCLAGISLLEQHEILASMSLRTAG